MHSIIGGQAGDFWPELFLIALTFATCALGVTAAVATVWSRRSKRLAELQESQFRHRMAQITIRRRLAEILDQSPAV